MPRPAAVSLQTDGRRRRHKLTRLAVCALKPAAEGDKFFADCGVDCDGGLKVLRGGKLG